MLFNKVDIRPILVGHFSTLRDNRLPGRASRADLLLFFGLPCVTGGVLIWLKFHFGVDAVNGFLNVFAILTGLLLNLLVLVFTLSTTSAPAEVDKAKRKLLLKEIFANVCFSVLIAIIVVCTALVALSYMRSKPDATTGNIATFLLSALTVNFTLTLLMIMKRMYILLNKEVGNDTSKPHRAA